MGVVQVPNPAGTACCDCSVQVDCSCGSGCIVKCRSIAGAGAFCGFAEFPGNVSNPPLFYRRSDISGSVSGSCSTDGFGCSPGHQNGCTQTFTYVGNCKFDKSTCVETQAGFFQSSGSCQPTSSQPECDISSGQVFTLNGVNITYPDIYTSTTHTFSSVNAGVCRTNGSGFVGCISTPSSMECQLSDQDQLADALLRSLGPDPTWNEADQGVCTSNTSFSTPWGPSGIFTFRKAQFQVTIPFATVGTVYAVQVKLYERATGTVAPFTPFGLLDITVSAESTGAVSAWIDTPDEGGLEILVAGCTSQVVP